MADSKETMVFYYDWVSFLESFSPDVAMAILRSLMLLDRDGIEPELPESLTHPLEKAVFDSMVKTVKKNRAAYLAKCLKNKDNGAKGGRPKNRTVSAKTERFSEKTDGFSSHDIDIDIENECGNEKELDYEYEKGKEKGFDNDSLYMREGAPSNIFVPPSAQDVEVYCVNKGYAIDAEAFVDFYASKGWMVGKNQMKDWHAAVRNWARNNRTEQKKQSVIDEIEGWIRND